MPPVVLFDGDCNLCDATVQFVIARDPGARFRFASLQSAAGRDLLAAHGRRLQGAPESVVLIEGGAVHERSGAALRILSGLGLPWSLAGVLWLVPRPVRDALYRWVARNRYRWFGRRTQCLAPSSALRARFLPEPPGEHPSP
ncbi:MAG: thiol-disulfide oxidoreductase DCC family protein [Deltaproteobacteria bacterium]|nr:thiol-disulfide oxidoreductase DCC family protein [Deltaproteobacteria bacterium]